MTVLVLKDENPHFPLVSVSQECDLCEIKGRTYQGCLLVFSELADGSAADYFPIRMPVYRKPELFSMICQIIMACLTLKKHGIVHGDLNFGNMLYHEEEEEKNNKEKYLHYIYGDKHLYIKHEGKLWVLWDFGKTAKEGDSDPIDTDFIYTGSLKVDVTKLLYNSVLRVQSDRKILEKISNAASINNIDEMFTAMSNLPNNIFIVSDTERDDLDVIIPTYVL